MAEKEGKTVDLLVVPGVDPFDAMVQTAAKLKASRLVTGVSAQMDSEELARRIGLAWEKLPEPRHPFSLEIITPGPPVDLRQPGTASAAALAGRSGPRARPLAAAAATVRPPSCIIAMWSAWRCAGWSTDLAGTNGTGSRCPAESWAGVASVTLADSPLAVAFPA